MIIFNGETCEVFKAFIESVLLFCLGCFKKSTLSFFKYGSTNFITHDALRNIMHTIHSVKTINVCFICESIID